MTESAPITLASSHSVPVTIDRLAAGARSKGLMVFARIDHAENAAAIGATLRPTELLIFGHPKGGTPLMQDRQVAGLDLPVRALSWEDESGRVWLSYYSGSAIAARHELGSISRAAVDAINAGMAMLCALAAGEDGARSI
jgi:uncharacterized protein (DUF302 family)